jgi:hypothetical protein
MTRAVIIALFITFLSSCSSGTAENRQRSTISKKAIEHFNIIVAVDLSNRQDPTISPRPLNDERIVKVLLDNVYPTILNSGRSEGQQDRYTIEVVNKYLLSEFHVNSSALTFDFSKFKRQVDRIDYLRNKLKGHTFSKDTAALMREFRAIRASARAKSYGADIWTFMEEGITRNAVLVTHDNLEYDGESYEVNFRNILIILTDGYIEADLYGAKGCKPEKPKQCYYLSKSRIDEFRKSFLKSGKHNVEAYFPESGYGIVPVDNPVLKDMEVLVLELNDRSKGKGGNATIHPTDLEIMGHFWTDWLHASSVKKVELWPIMARPEDVESVILNFLGVQKNN